MIRIGACGAAVLAATVIGGCSSSADMGTAEKNVTRFHAQLDAGELDAIYQGADPRFRAASPPGDFLKFIGAVHRKLGNSVSTSRTGYRVNYNTAGNTVELGYQTRYQRGEASEQFVFAMGGGKAALLGYNIQSQALIIN